MENFQIYEIFIKIFWLPRPQKFWWKLHKFENSPLTAIHNDIFLVQTKFEKIFKFFWKM